LPLSNFTTYASATESKTIKMEKENLQNKSLGGSSDLI
jgi:hypothetical protein